MKNRLTKEALKRMNRFYALITYYKKYPSGRKDVKIKELKRELAKVKKDPLSYEPSYETNNKLRSVRAQIWNIKNLYPHRSNRLVKLEDKLRELLNAG